MRKGIREAALALALMLASGVRADEVLFDDTLHGGWRDASDAPVSVIYSGAHGGNQCVAVEFVGSYTSYCLQHEPLSMRPYGALRFWVQIEGRASLRDLYVAATVDGRGRTAVSLASFAPAGGDARRSWQQVTVPLTALGVENADNVSGFWLMSLPSAGETRVLLDDIVLTPAQAPSAAVAISADGLERGWESWSRAEVDLTSRQQAFTGRESIRVSIRAPHQGLYLRRTRTPVSGEALSFWVHGGESGGQKICVGVAVGTDVPRLAPLENYAALEPGRWSHAVVPLAALGVAPGQPVSGVLLWDAAGRAQKTFYVDDFSIIGGTGRETRSGAGAEETESVVVRYSGLLWALAAVGVALVAKRRIFGV